MPNHAAQRAADRKAALLIAGARYRDGLVQSKMIAARGLQVESLIQAAVAHAADFARARLGASLLPSGNRFQAVVPLAIAACSYLLRQKPRPAVLGAGLAAATAAVLIALRHRHGALKAKRIHCEP